MKRVRHVSKTSKIQADNLTIEYDATIPSLLKDSIRVAVRTAGLQLYSHGKDDGVVYTPGIDFAGVVEALGEEASSAFSHKFPIGTKVFGTLVEGKGRVHVRESQKLERGTYASHVLINPQYDLVEILPEGIDFEAGAAATSSYFLAYRIIFELLRCEPTDSILVCQARGGLGAALVELATRLPARVIITVSSAQEVRLAHELNTVHVLNHYSESVIEDIMDYTNGEGVDWVVDLSQDLSVALQVIKSGGTIVVSQNERNTEPANWSLISEKEIAIKGASLWAGSRQSQTKALAYILAKLKFKEINPIIQTYPLEQVVMAHKEGALQSDVRGAGHIVFEI